MAGSAAVASPFGGVLHEYTLLAEFKLAQKHAAKGLYLAVNPSGHWDGVIFVHSGPFEGGIFRFRVLIAEAHPTEVTPRVFFQTTVYHPQINPDTGELSTSRHFPRWRPGKDKLWHLLKLVRHTFYSISVKEPVFNREAADLLAQPDGAASFAKKAEECAVASAEPSPCNNILDFTERFDDRGTTRLCALMLKWGDGDDASIAATNEFFAAAAVSDRAPQPREMKSLSEALKELIGRQADTADTVLSNTRCKGFLSVPDESDDWQRRWAVLTYPRGLNVDSEPGSPPRGAQTGGDAATPRTPGSAKGSPRPTRADKGGAGPAASFSLVFFEDKTEMKRVGSIDCASILRAFQPPAPEMKSNNTFLIILPDRVVRLQAPSNNAMMVWLHALNMQA